jgi:hypothetical protein
MFYSYATVACPEYTNIQMLPQCSLFYDSHLLFAVLPSLLLSSVFFFFSFATRER